MKKKRINAIRTIAILSAFALLVLLPVFYLQAKQSYDFEVKLEIGLGREVMLNCGAPFNITAENKSTNSFDGYIQLIVPGYNNNNYLYEEKITLGPGEKKTVQIISGLSVPAQYVNVRFADKKHKVVWKELQDITVTKEKKDIKVGVLTDDFSALSYIDRRHFLSNPEMAITLIELNDQTLPEDYHALDTLDVILISDFSTDLLTQKQINALNLWVQNGGFMIIGTGSTATKTLSGIKGKVVNVNAGNMQSRFTAFDLDVWDYSYLSGLWFNNANQKTALKPTVMEMFDYYTKYDDDFAARPYDDQDGDGYNDYVFNLFATSSLSDGSILDARNNVISPDYAYLLADSAFSQDPATGEYHYKYYAERYGNIDKNDYAYQDYLNYPIFTDEEFEAFCMTEYCYVYQFDPKWYIYEYMGEKDPNQIDAIFDQYWGADFEEFKDYMIWVYACYSYYGTDVRTDITQSQNNDILGSYTGINVDCTTIDLPDALPSDVVTMSSNSGEFEFAKYVYTGDGLIMVCAVDFTKNPLPKTDYSGELVRNIIEKYRGFEIINNANNYNSNYNNNYYSYSYYGGGGTPYNLKKMLNSSSSAPMPATLIYAAIILAFFIFILVIYIVMLKKKKTYSLWKIYPISAILFSIVIFCVGFSTRVIRLNLNIISIMTPSGSMTKEVDYVTAIIPKKKDYTVKFTKDVEVDKSFTGTSDYHSFYPSEVDYDVYSMYFRDNYEDFESVITNKVALESQCLKAESAFMTQGGIEIEYQADPKLVGYGPENIKITNNYSTALNDVTLIINDTNMYSTNLFNNDYYFATIKPGESVVATQGVFIDEYSKRNNTYSHYSYRSNYAVQHYEENNIGTIIKGMLLGDFKLFGKSYSEFGRRKAVLTYAVEQYMLDDSVMVVAFPKSSIGSKVVDDKRCKVNRTEAIIVDKLFTDISHN